ncbi:MAG: hypothetical protein M1829_005927 [Trizodia sp. TS-e1964]|nr:MAG: hypothetical protein M1829_005927 [Trizodia sp. TS-e1964]
MQDGIEATWVSTRKETARYAVVIDRNAGNISRRGDSGAVVALGGKPVSSSGSMKAARPLVSESTTGAENRKTPQKRAAKHQPSSKAMTASVGDSCSDVFSVPSSSEDDQITPKKHYSASKPTDKPAAPVLKPSKQTSFPKVANEKSRIGPSTISLLKNGAKPSNTASKRKRPQQCAQDGTITENLEMALQSQIVQDDNLRLTELHKLDGAKGNTFGEKKLRAVRTHGSEEEDDVVDPLPKRSRTTTPSPQSSRISEPQPLAKISTRSRVKPVSFTERKISTKISAKTKAQGPGNPRQVLLKPQDFEDRDMKDVSYISPSSPTSIEPKTIFPLQEPLLSTVIPLLPQLKESPSRIPLASLQLSSDDEIAPALQTLFPMEPKPRKRLIDSMAAAPQSLKSADNMNIAKLLDSALPALPKDQGIPESSLDCKLQISKRDSASDSGISMTLAMPAAPIEGPKFTYARQRSYLNEESSSIDALFDLPLDVPSYSSGQRGRRALGSKSNFPETLPGVAEELDLDDDAEGGAIRSIHELRQAGGNKRFLDEMEALLEDIRDVRKTSLSRRRNGLLELVGKLNNKATILRFLENGLEQRLFTNLDTESDIVVNFILASALIFLLSGGLSKQSLLLIRKHGVLPMLTGLLATDQDIIAVAKDRRTNMSKVAQGMVASFRDTLMKSDFFVSDNFSNLSPRLIGLMSMDLFSRKLLEIGDGESLLPHNTMQCLVNILSRSCTWKPAIQPSQSQIVELELALSILESCTTGENISGEVPTLADDLAVAVAEAQCHFSQWNGGEFKQLQVLGFRLNLNITNNNGAICDIFAQGGYFVAVINIVKVKFKLLSGDIDEEERLYTVDFLILALASLINLAEWSELARLSVLQSRSEESSPLECLLDLFAGRQERVSEVCSLQNSLPTILLTITTGGLIGGNTAQHCFWISFNPTRESLQECRDHD